MPRKPLALTAALMMLGAGTATAGPAVEPQPVVVALPRPTGPHPVGVRDLHLTDPDRLDPWEPERGARQLMASVYYPATTTRGYPPAPHMRPGAAARFAEIDVRFLHPELPDAGVDWAATTTHAHVGAPASRRSRPVLVYTPGGGDPRSTGTVLATELASRGFVVVTVDHPGDVSEVEFPDGDVRLINPAADPRTPEGFRKILGIRLADVRFVLDELRGLRRELPVDLNRVGVIGHSIGGSAAAQSLHEDRRVDAAVNLEGFLDYTGSGELLPVAEHGTRKPLLLFGTDGYWNDRYERTWSAMLASSCHHDRHERTESASSCHHDNYKQTESAISCRHERTGSATPACGCRTTKRILPDATHWVFTDFAPIATHLHTDGLMTTAERDSLVGPIAPAHALPAIHDRVAGFFARALR